MTVEAYSAATDGRLKGNCSVEAVEFVHDVNEYRGSRTNLMWFSDVKFTQPSKYQPLAVCTFKGLRQTGQDQSKFFLILS